ncbi:transcriptional regulator, BadM/Rrf2 family [Salinimicrobium catena]|uniref:Transcriptional regulator, BadM/Rrf2 family n=1 Tax=Salinimicrobium catena TaxID=390640 RepID=A0A1H5LZK1_9FLAO|nr:Rrf2 family transcriptional regulator [Salinimicrobium catena]SDL16742.1 transcriptional regulator, BadM/Rrf2 family [Salinimicrobium catena]SEE82565.1 transcriptional regulator, BadM/Rrf2 family [Salinimicrobium catena]
MLSSSSKYAINAVLYLAVNASVDKKIRATEIAEAIGVPSPFLSKLLQILSRERKLSSSKGPKGGFYLTDEEKQLHLIEVVKSIDGVDRLEDCVLGLKKCSSEQPCPVHFAVQPFKNKFLQELEENTIEHFAEKVKKGEAYLFI